MMLIGFWWPAASQHWSSKAAYHEGPWSCHTSATTGWAYLVGYPNTDKEELIKLSRLVFPLPLQLLAAQ
eukprot:11722828-Ditylum_brightwellii.AAC.1